MLVVIRRARKAHQCVICGADIQPGEDYVHHTALPGVRDDLDFVLDNKPTTFATHRSDNETCRQRQREAARLDRESWGDEPW